MKVIAVLDEMIAKAKARGGKLKTRNPNITVSELERLRGCFILVPDFPEIYGISCDKNALLYIKWGKIRGGNNKALALKLTIDARKCSFRCQVIKAGTIYLELEMEDLLKGFKKYKMNRLTKFISWHLQNPL